MTEYWDVRDINGRKTGATMERGAAFPVDGYHLVVDVWIKNADGAFLISRRCPDKYLNPGLWEPTCGSALAGEDSLTAALREVREEMGITLDAANGRRVRRLVRPESHGLFDVWLFAQEVDIATVVLQPGETDDVMWADTHRIFALELEGRFMSRAFLPYLDELLHGGNCPLQLGSTCLMTRNTDTMVAFYSALFKTPPVVDGGVDYRFPEARLTVFRLTDDTTPASANAALIYESSDVDAEHERLRRLGITAAPPTDKPWGVRSFIVRDPDGHTVSIVTPLT